MVSFLSGSDLLSIVSPKRKPSTRTATGASPPQNLKRETDQNQEREQTTQGVATKKSINKENFFLLFFHPVLVLCLLPGAAAELVKLPAVGEDDESDLGVAEHGELVGFLEEPIPPLREGHLAINLVLDSLQLHPSPPHLLSSLSEIARRDSKLANGKASGWKKRRRRAPFYL